jgi:hypothetical protein
MREFLTLFVDWLLRQSVTESTQIEICAQISPTFALGRIFRREAVCFQWRFAKVCTTF